MKCPKCGHENVAGAKFCIECGFAVSGVESDLETDRSLGDDATIMTPGVAADPTSATSPTSPQYEILKPLGQGGMGVVYLARDTRLDIEVAIKRLAGDMADRDRSVQRFLTEARSIAQLNHQNIVRVNTVGEDAEGHFIVMEFIDGPDLDELIRRQGKLTVPDALELFRAICNGVSYAHTRGVIHRDIKPSNIIMSAGRIPKLVDFGLARIGRESDVSMTGYGLGTMSYMSPEQKRDAKHVDHRSDIFALAKTLYFMVTGKDPDTVDYDLIPAAIREPLLRAMKPDPADRYFMVDQFLDDVETAAAGAGQVEEKPKDADVETAIICPDCGQRNHDEVKFCTGCGAGLFETCPNQPCGVELRRGTAFCGACGVNIQEHRTYLDHVRSAQGYLRLRKFSRARKEVDLALALQPDGDEIEEVAAELQELEHEIASIEQSISRAATASDHAEVIRWVEKLATIDPDDQRYAEQLATARVRLEAEVRQRTEPRDERHWDRRVRNNSLVALLVILIGIALWFAFKPGAEQQVAQDPYVYGSLRSIMDPDTTSGSGLVEFDFPEFEYVMGDLGIIRDGHRLYFLTGPDLDSAISHLNGALIGARRKDHPTRHLVLQRIKRNGIIEQDEIPFVATEIPMLADEDQVDLSVPGSNIVELRFYKKEIKQQLGNVIQTGGEFVRQLHHTIEPEGRESASSKDMAWYLVGPNGSAWELVDLAPGTHYMLTLLAELDLPLIGCFEFTEFQDDYNLRKMEHAKIGHVVGAMRLHWFRYANSYVIGYCESCEQWRHQGSRSGIEALRESPVGKANGFTLPPDAEAKMKIRRTKIIMASSDSLIAPSNVGYRFSNPHDLAALEPESDSESVVSSERPRCIERPAPTYPELARDAGLEGNVIVKVLVGTNGDVIRAEIVISVHPLLDNQALEAARLSKWHPGLQNGEPVQTWQMMPYNFRMN